jgi:HEPN domain-containing protein
LFTYYHSIELYLKAFLRAQGHTLARLQDIGHGYDTLHRLSADCGLPFRDEDTDVLNVLARPGAWSATRYLEVGYNIRPTLSALSRTCKSLDRSVGDALIARGIRIRRMTRGVRVTN